MAPPVHCRSRTIIAAQQEVNKTEQAAERTCWTNGTVTRILTFVLRGICILHPPTARRLHQVRTSRVGHIWDGMCMQPLWRIPSNATKPKTTPARYCPASLKQNRFWLDECVVQFDTVAQFSYARTKWRVVIRVNYVCVCVCVCVCARARVLTWTVSYCIYLIDRERHCVGGQCQRGAM